MTDIYALIKRIIPTKDNFKQVQQEMKFSSNVSEAHDRQLEIAAVTIIICWLPNWIGTDRSTITMQCANVTEQIINILHFAVIDSSNWNRGVGACLVIIKPAAYALLTANHTLTTGTKLGFVHHILANNTFKCCRQFGEKGALLS